MGITQWKSRGNENEGRECECKNNPFPVISVAAVFFSVLWLVAVSNVTHVADVTGFLCSVVNTYLSCCNGI